VAEGAALEMPCTGNCTVGSNPTPSAISPALWVENRDDVAGWREGVRWPLIGDRQRWAVLDGEVAVPCNPQSATAGLNSLSRAGRVE
jgi:hypothetical protein